MIAALAIAANVLVADLPEAPTLSLITEENPPFTYSQPGSNQPGGVISEIVFELMARAGVDYTVEVLPWKRGFLLAQKEPNTCVFGIDRIPSREDKFQWVTPLFDGAWALFKRPDSDIEISSLLDANNYRVAGTLGYASAEMLEKAGVRNILTAASNVDAMTLLYHKRVDLIILGQFEASGLAKQIGVPRPAEAITYGSSRMSLGCSLSTDQNIMERLQETNSSMSDFREAILAQKPD